MWRDHNKDYRSLAACPPRCLRKFVLELVRVDYWGNPSVEKLVGEDASHKGRVGRLVGPAARRLALGAGAPRRTGGWPRARPAAGGTMARHTLSQKVEEFFHETNRRQL